MGQRSVNHDGTMKTVILSICSFRDRTIKQYTQVHFDHSCLMNCVLSLTGFIRSTFFMPRNERSSFIDREEGHRDILIEVAEDLPRNAIIGIR